MSDATIEQLSQDRGIKSPSYADIEKAREIQNEKAAKFKEQYGIARKTIQDS